MGIDSDDWKVDFEFEGGTTYTVSVFGDVPPVFRHAKLKRVSVSTVHKELHEFRISSHDIGT